MKNPEFKYLIILAVFLFNIEIEAQSTTPNYTAFYPGEIWKDSDGNHINAHGGGMMFKDGTYYWYGEHKGKSSLAKVGITVYSSEDLYNWSNEGVALSVAKDPDSEITSGSVMERPKVVYNEKTGQYVMWFHLELKGQGYSAARTGVATSDSPTGPFKYLRSYRPNSGKWPRNFNEEWKETPEDEPQEWWTPEWSKALAKGLYVRRDFKKGQMSRDMTIYIDKDGTAYHITSSEENQTLHISKLTEDYLDFTGEWVRMRPGGQNEAPAVFEKDGYYYMITSGLTGWDPNAARSFRSKSIMGPWESLGNPARGENADKTFFSQSTFILPVQGKEDEFIFMADRWKPENHIDGRYIWLPIEWENDKPIIKWRDNWKL